jgi:hypothetical protein
MIGRIRAWLRRTVGQLRRFAALPELKAPQTATPAFDLVAPPCAGLADIACMAPHALMPPQDALAPLLRLAGSGVSVNAVLAPHERGAAPEWRIVITGAGLRVRPHRKD